MMMNHQDTKDTKKIKKNNFPFGIHVFRNLFFFFSLFLVPLVSWWFKRFLPLGGIL